MRKQGGVKDGNHFCNLPSLQFETNVSLLLAYNQPEFILLSCLIARELRKNETVDIGLASGGERWGESLVCSVQFSLLLRP